MRPEDWHLTDDAEDFHARAGDFLRSRPALHNTLLTGVERLRTRGPDAHGAEAALFGRLEAQDGVRAVFHRTARGHLSVTPLSAGQADALAGRLAALGLRPCGVIAEHDTASLFARTWQRHTSAAPAPFWRARLYRLGTLTPPRPRPAGRSRAAVRTDHDHVVRWCREFCADVGERPSLDLLDSGRWSDSRFGDRHFTLWEAPDGTPVSMAAVTSIVDGVLRVDPVYTPARFRGRGYAGAVTAAVSAAALAAGATDVVLFADPANPTSNALYQRLGYIRVADFTGYAFSYGAPGAGQGLRP